LSVTGTAADTRQAAFAPAPAVEVWDSSKKRQKLDDMASLLNNTHSKHPPVVSERLAVDGDNVGAEVLQSGRGAGRTDLRTPSVSWPHAFERLC
jgi:hypothetical protein